MPWRFEQDSDLYDYPVSQLVMSILKGLHQEDEIGQKELEYYVEVLLDITVSADQSHMRDTSIFLKFIEKCILHSKNNVSPNMNLQINRLLACLTFYLYNNSSKLRDDLTVQRQLVYDLDREENQLNTSSQAFNNLMSVTLLAITNRSRDDLLHLMSSQRSIDKLGHDVVKELLDTSSADDIAQKAFEFYSTEVASW